MHLARRLLAQDTSSGSDDSELAAVALRKTCERAASSLRNGMGSDACNALLLRALTRVEAEHPLIRELRPSGDGGMSFDGLVQCVDEHGVAPTTAAIEALLAALIDVLVRLVGEELTIRLFVADAVSRPAAHGGPKS